MELSELRDLMIAIESQAFQTLIMKPLFKEMDAMKSAYDCGTLNELARLRGKREGLQMVIDRIKIAQEEYQNKLNSEE